MVCHLACSIDPFPAASTTINAWKCPQMTEDVPIRAGVSKTEVVPRQMAKRIPGVFPGLVTMTKAANVTNIPAKLEKGGVNPSRYYPKFLGLRLRIRERTRQHR